MSLSLKERLEQEKLARRKQISINQIIEQKSNSSDFDNDDEPEDSTDVKVIKNKLAENAIKQQELYTVLRDLRKRKEEKVVEYDK